MALDLCVDLGLGPDGAGDEVAHGRGCSFGGGDVASAKLLFDEGVVGGEEGEFPSAAAVATAVADVGEPEGGWDGVDGDGGV